MKPGRELDALIAEKVMGASWQEMGPNPFISTPNGPLIQYAWKIDENYYLDKEDFPHYSTNIGLAWQVVEKISDDDFSIEQNGTHWKVHFGIHWTGSVSAPHAICLASLKVVGHEL